MSNTPIVRNTGPGAKWWLAILLAVIIIAIVLGAYFATHPHAFGGSKTATPTRTVPTTVKATGTPVPGPTGTPKPGPTGTPRAGPTSTPKTGPTGTPVPAPTSTDGVRTGQISHTQALINMTQQKANQLNHAFTYYVNPGQVVQHNLPGYGFTSGQFTIKSPPVSPTPTAYPNKLQLPQIEFIVAYRSVNYGVFLDQPVQQGPKGIWVIITIRSCGSASTC